MFFTEVDGVFIWQALNKPNYGSITVSTTKYCSLNLGPSLKKKYTNAPLLLCDLTIYYSQDDTRWPHNFYVALFDYYYLLISV